MTDTRRHAWPVPALLAAVLLALVFAMSIFRYFDSDELEHVHSAWYVLNGAVPYVDFFEHHHAPLWYLLAPALAVLPEAAWALVALRLAFFLLVPATAWATYRLARECGAARETAWLSVFLLLSMTTFTYVAIEVRPDVPQTLLGVTSAIFFVRLLRTQRARDAVLCGLAAAAAFLFLQKVVLLFPLYAAAFTVAAVSRRVRWRLGWYAAAAFAAACAPFAAWLAVAGAFDDYVVTNWLINARVGAGRSPWSFLVAATLRDFGRNAVFWALSIAMGVEAFRRRPQAPYALPAWFGWGLVALIFATNRVVDRYLVAAIPFLAAAAGMWLAEEAARRRVAGPRVTALLLVVCLLPTIGMTRSVFRSNRDQLETIQFVLDHSAPGDRMYDEWGDFNVFRPDLHYFWFMTSPGVRLYNGLTGGRYADYDVCRLIAEAKPRFVSNRAGRLAACGLAGLYRPTRFGRLVERAAD
jgi:4-amino-4-deoxy-L-arabinose transferase-like glycosyltransferase